MNTDEEYSAILSETPWWEEIVYTCFFLSSSFSCWHCIRDCLSRCSSWFSWEFSRHFWVCWTDNTSSSLCNNWISFLQWPNRRTGDVVQYSKWEFWTRLKKYINQQITWLYSQFNTGHWPALGVVVMKSRGNKRSVYMSLHFFQLFSENVIFQTQIVSFTVKECYWLYLSTKKKKKIVL